VTQPILWHFVIITWQPTKIAEQPQIALDSIQTRTMFNRIDEFNIEPIESSNYTSNLWLWLQKTEPNCPWSALPIQIPAAAQAFFSAAMQVEVGDGRNTLFWSDRWVHGQRIADIVPRLIAAVQKKKNKNVYCP
jgi:hypothetical protein